MVLPDIALDVDGTLVVACKCNRSCPLDLFFIRVDCELDSNLLGAGVLRRELVAELCLISFLEGDDIEVFLPLYGILSKNLLSPGEVDDIELQGIQVWISPAGNLDSEVGLPGYPRGRSDCEGSLRQGLRSRHRYQLKI